MASSFAIADIERELDDVEARSVKRRSPSRGYHGRRLTKKLSPLAVERRGTHAGQLPPINDEDDRASTDSDFYDTDIEVDEDVHPVKADKTECEQTYRTACVREGVVAQEKVANSFAVDSDEINIRHRCLDDADIVALSRALAMSTTVTRLELAGNHVGGLGAVNLRTALISSPNIEYLDLSDNDLGRNTASAVAISELLRANTGLQTLKLAGNNFRDPDAMYLAVGIQMNNRLVVLDLSRNIIGEAGAIHIGRALAVNNGIDEFDISWNQMRQKGAVGLCKGLQSNGYVTKLNVAWNGFGYGGSLAVGELLKRNATITDINLASNLIDWKGIILINEGLAKNKTLEALILDNNPLTTTGAMDLIETLSENANSAVVNLSLKGVPVVGEFDLMTFMIRSSRPEFQCIHGGIVSSPDILGRRLEKRVTPVQKVLNFMKEREYRLSELFRILDKDVSKKMSSETLATRLRQIGIQLPQHEVEELLDFINEQKQGATQQPRPQAGRRGSVNFKTMSVSVKNHQYLERLDKIRDQEKEQLQKAYHRKILTDTDSDGIFNLVDDEYDMLPPISERSQSEYGTLYRSNSRGSFATGASYMTRGTKTDSQRGASTKGSSKTSAGVLSMSGSLGSKPAEFGHGGAKKKGKGSKKKKSKRK